jgi:hypothetical protein
MVIDASHWPAREGPLTIPWPVPGNPGYIYAFQRKGDWLAFLRRLDLHAAVPMPTTSKYLRAQKLYAYAWLEYDFIKAAELVALSALEGALSDCYGKKAVAIRKGKKNLSKPMLAELMTYMIECDGLTDTIFPFAQRYSGEHQGVVSALYEKEAERQKRTEQAKAAKTDPSRMTSPEPITLATIRNGLTHGEALEGFPWGGLLEIVKDLIEYAYRTCIADMEASSILPRE